MRLSDRHFGVLDALGSREISSQRQLAQIAGISLGQANYVLKSLLKKNLVKIDVFRKNPNKISYLYLLTPKGLEAKSRLGAKYILAKLREYKALRRRLAERLAEIAGQGFERVAFVGPLEVRDLLLSIIKENDLNVVLACTLDWSDDLKALEKESLDAVLAFGEDGQGKRFAAGKELANTKVILLV